MPCWYFEKDELVHSPSEADGINAETESRYREEGAGFIIELANKLGIQYDTYAAAVVYFHRFHVLQSFRNFHRHVTATSCLLLSSKTQENKTTLPDLLKTIKLLLSEKQFSVFGSDAQQEVVQTEMALLETLKFDLDVIHPYAYLLHYTKLLKGDKDRIQQVLHTSWTFVNDSLYTTLCVQYEPDLLAVAFLYLACRLTKFEVTDWMGKPEDYAGKWYNHFVSDMNIEILKDICGQVLGLYSKGKKDEQLVVARKSSSRARDARSPSPVARRDRRRSGSPGQRSSRRRSLSPLPRRSTDSSSAIGSRIYDLDRVSPLPLRSSRRSSHSRSRSRHRRSSYSRSPEEQRRRNRLPPPPSPSRRSPAVVAPPLESPGTFFLSRESFEEIQAQLRAKSGQQPPPPDTYTAPLPPPPRFTQYQDPMQPPSYAPAPTYPPVGYHAPPPTAQVVVAYPYQPQQQQPLPPASSHPSYSPGAGFAQRPPPPEFVGQSHQIIVHQHPHQPPPPVMTQPPVMTMHHPVQHIPGQQLAHPHPNPEMHVYGHPPGPPYHQPGMPPPDFMRPPLHQDMHVYGHRVPGPFAYPEGPSMRGPPPPVPGSPGGEVLWDGSRIETSPDGKRWIQAKKITFTMPRTNLIRLGGPGPNPV